MANALYKNKFELFGKGSPDNLFVLLYGTMVEYRSATMYPLSCEHTLRNIISLLRIFIRKGRDVFAVITVLFTFTNPIHKRQSVPDYVFGFRKSLGNYPFFKYASDFIWWAGKNNFDILGACCQCSGKRLNKNRPKCFVFNSDI
jgi:hypothetical protein